MNVQQLMLPLMQLEKSIKDTIEEHFENEGKFDYDSKGGIVYEIKGDLKDYVQDPNNWDNTERFNNHEDYRDRHLQDILYDFDLKYQKVVTDFNKVLLM